MKPPNQPAFRLFTCRPGYETILVRELAGRGIPAHVGGAGWVRADAPTATPDAAAPDLCFAVWSIEDAVEVRASSVNAMAEDLCGSFWEFYRGEKIERDWCLRFEAAAENDVGGRVRPLRAEFLARLKGKMSRIAGMAAEALPPPDVPVRGFHVFVPDYGRVFAGSRFRFGGQRRMKDDPDAPSRSFLKVEEACCLFGRFPGPGETVVDLGAAPGGWSYSAACRGARVLAVDNGPLKAGARSHPEITHVREDAFGFRPASRDRVDWLFCDLIEDPYRVLTEILLPWLDGRLCRAFVVNLKVGKGDPVELVRKLREDGRLALTRRCADVKIRHLFHDREEITCVGRIRD